MHDRHLLDSIRQVHNLMNQVFFSYISIYINHLLNQASRFLSWIFFTSLPRHLDFDVNINQIEYEDQNRLPPLSSWIDDVEESGSTQFFAFFFWFFFPASKKSFTIETNKLDKKSQCFIFDVRNRPRIKLWYSSIYFVNREWIVEKK